MQEQFGYKNLTPRELVEKLRRGEKPVLLDVREPWEYERARIWDSRLVPMADLPNRLGLLDPGAEIVVICHHGLRSAHVTRFLEHSGFQNVYNLEGGIDAYADFDDGVPKY